MWKHLPLSFCIQEVGGKTAADLVENLKELIIDYTAHEGAYDAFWSKVNVHQITIEFRYDLEAFFEQHGYLKISAVAEQAGLNTSLVRQYASGVKSASVEQAKKIERAIHQIGKELQAVAIYA